MRAPVEVELIQRRGVGPLAIGARLSIELDWPEILEIVRTGQIKAAIVDDVIVAIMKATP